MHTLFPFILTPQKSISEKKINNKKNIQEKKKFRMDGFHLYFLHFDWLRNSGLSSYDI